MLHRFTMLLQLAVGAKRLLRRLLRLTCRILERLDSSVELFEVRRHAGGAIRYLLERFAERSQLGAASGQRGQHRADGAALLASRGDQQLEFIGLLLNELAFAAAGHV